MPQETMTRKLNKQEFMDLAECQIEVLFEGVETVDPVKGFITLAWVMNETLGEKMDPEDVEGCQALLTSIEPL